jgi:hypothetical protein
MDIANPPAVVRQAEMTEQQIVEAVKVAIAQIDVCKWEVGRLAHEWTERYANGRTDEDFAKLAGLTRANVQQRRQVFATYGDVCKTFCKLSWSHFLVVLDWNDADEWLASANDNQWSVATMKRMRDIQNRADRGEDLSQPAKLDEAFPELAAAAGDFPEVEHVGDVDPFKPEPSIVKPTPKEPKQETVSDPPRVETETAASTQSASPATSKPTALTGIVDRLDALLCAISAELNTRAERKQIADRLRKRADEYDPPETETTATPAAIVAAEWNMIANVSRCSVVTKKRQQTVRTRMQDDFWQTNWRKAMRKVAGSSFCTGTNDRGWKANLDWFLRPDTVPRIMEGQFDDNSSGSAHKDVWRVPPSDFVPEVEDRTQRGVAGDSKAAS